MKKILRNRRRDFSFALRTGASMLLIAAAVLALTLFREPLTNLLLKILSPIVSVRNALQVSENAKLAVTLEEARALLADRALLYEENIYLKRLLQREPQVALTLGSILQRPPGTPYDTLLLDIGSLEGIVVGDLVSAGGGALIGEVSEVYDHFSRVVLFSSPGKAHEGLLYRSSTEEVVPLRVEGQGGGALIAQAPSGTGAKGGDLVLIPGIGSGISAQVVAVEVGESESFEILHLRLPVNPYHLRFVEVRRGGAQYEE